MNVFYALSLIGTAAPSDLTYANQLQATAILEPLFGKHPEHPGVAHYIIHAYDYPPLAPRGLKAAQRYGEVAPWVPHALHMPSHIYTRLGSWKESVETNQASAEASRAHAAQKKRTAAEVEELHALDYMMVLVSAGRARRAGEGSAGVRLVDQGDVPRARLRRRLRDGLGARALRAGGCLGRGGRAEDPERGSGSATRSSRRCSIVARAGQPARLGRQGHCAQGDRAHVVAAHCHAPSP